MVAVYLTPIIGLALGLDPASSNAIAFGLGLIGMYVCEAIIELGKGYRKNPGKLQQDLRALVLRLLGGPGNDPKS
jgi:hypothetical protein